NRFPLLTQEQETALGRRLQQQGDIDAARSLVLSHLRLVVAVSRNYVGYGLPQADLIQEGNVGLMKAVRRFDPERGVRLVSFALHWIKAEIHEYILRNWRLVKVATTKAQRKLFFNLRSMKTSTAALTTGEARAIATELGVKPAFLLSAPASCRRFLCPPASCRRYTVTARPAYRARRRGWSGSGRTPTPWLRSSTWIRTTSRATTPCRGRQ